MPSKLGCGPMLAFILIALILILIGANEAFGYYLSHCGDMDVVDCFLNNQEDKEPEEGNVTATGTYEYKGTAVNITMSFPLTGGAVTGTVSGTCDGKVKGTYVNGAAISGSMTGACSPFFVNIPASADFSGTVNKPGKTVQLQFQGSGGGFEHEGSLILTYP